MSTKTEKKKKEKLLCYPLATDSWVFLLARGHSSHE